MKKNGVHKRSKGSKKISSKKPGFKYPLKPLVAVIVVGLLTFLIFYPSLDNDFVNWDDPVYVLNNMHIQNFDFGILIEMFNPFPKHYLLNNYHPFTELSLAIDHIFYGLNPKGYHFTNMFLHSINSCLVFLLIFRMTNGRVIAGILTALFFGIHPMHVESVAWVSERKDVLHVFFYLLAMLSYLKYLKSGYKNRKWVGYTLLLFICSLLSKAQAVTLPIVLLLMDYYYNRKDLKNIFLEKAPFFFLSLLFGLLAIRAQVPATIMVEIPWVYRPFTASYALFSYLWMSIAPVGLSALHPYPFGAGESPPPYIFASILVIFVFLGGVYLSWKKKQKEIAFGLAFFFFTILPVLQLLTVGEAIIAERYTYLPYIGLFFICGYYLDTTFTNFSRKKYKTPALAIALLASIAFAGISWNRIPDWKNSLTLWNNILDRYPDTRVAYVNLSSFFIDSKDYDKGIEYADKGLEIDPNHYKLFVNKAVSLIQKNQHKAAIQVLEEAIKRDPDHTNIYYNLGFCYENLNQHDKSFEYYNKALEYEPDHIEALLHRGIIYGFNKNDQAKAIADFEKVIEYNPKHTDALMNIAVSFTKTKQYQKALEYVNRSINSQPENGKSYYFRSIIYQALGQNDKAQIDRNQATRLGYSGG